MAFKPGKLVVKDQDLPEEDYAYKSVHDVPGYAYLAKNGFRDCMAYIEQNLNSPAMCHQIVETRQAVKVAYNTDGDCVAAYGWKILEHLGKGKDGDTFWGYKYGDVHEQKNIIKVKSTYGKNFDNHSVIFNQMIRQLMKKGVPRHPCLHDQTIKNRYNNYKLKVPYKPVKNRFKEIHHSLVDVCNMNAWCIKNTGLVFWDMGYGNGRNFMKDTNGATRWVDYGGAGMLQCPTFEGIYSQFKGLPVIELGTGTDQRMVKGKDSLIIGDSDFVMCQFLLNYEYHSEPETTADLYSSILQVKRAVIPEIRELLPKLIKTKMGKAMYEAYRRSNWLDETTWRGLAKFIDAATQNT